MVKLEKLNLRTGNQILIKFDVWKDVVSQSSYFRSRSDPVTVVGAGGPKILENA